MILISTHCSGSHIINDAIQVSLVTEFESQSSALHLSVDTTVYPKGIENALCGFLATKFGAVCVFFFQQQQVVNQLRLPVYLNRQRTKSL